MGREHKKRRRTSIRQRQKRRAKLKKLRTAHTKAKDNSKKEQIIEKVFKIAPWLSKEEFLKPAVPKSTARDKKSSEGKEKEEEE